jgi:enamine deaminase RidA (YjgF/YER057c/UK114 family)
MRTHYRSASPYEDRVGFARAVRVHNSIMVAGTAPIGPDGNTVDGDTYEQARRCFAIAVEALDALGGSAADVVRTRMYLVDPSDQDAVGRAHKEFFDQARPAATMVVVRELVDPSWRVEVEVDAVVDSA